MASQTNTSAMMDDTDWSDDDAIYESHCVELKPEIHTNELNLFEPLPTYRDGAMKSSVKGKETGEIVHYKAKSDCSVSITRLLWIDGWRNGDCSERMSLVVLKVGFKPESRHAKVTYASVKLRLKSDKKEDVDPRLEAWGPFRHPETWNGVEAHKRRNVSSNITLGAEGGGAQASVGVEGMRETEWDETYTDRGRSSEKYSKDSDGRAGSPNGVLWEVFQNPRLNRGITPEVRVAGLFSRSTPGPYKVELRITADTGTGSEILHRGMRMFGKGGDRIYWTVAERLRSTDNCHAEGKDILKHVDVDSLGKLVDPGVRTSLSAQWLNKWERVEMPRVAATAEDKPAQPTHTTAAYSSSLMQEVREIRLEETEASKANAQTHQVSLEPDGAAALPANMPQPVSTKAATANLEPEVSRDSSVVVTTTQSLSVPYNRLLDLETRTAQAESRIAQQDRHITELQRTLTRVAQALLGIGRLDQD
ncbi:hypothetical protein F53441_4307 [Fusarium austroafricanum]|uniref:Uncharacterized protein n=1 Tax=Fusarium austroafricanum TaxID=2364996 RepID=A0A8H4KKM3_9HYPO|nr:hypothetical protein F53441_4307 [Fusarium austroafricanum]